MARSTPGFARHVHAMSLIPARNALLALAAFVVVPIAISATDEHVAEIPMGLMYVLFAGWLALTVVLLVVVGRRSSATRARAALRAAAAVSARMCDAAQQPSTLATRASHLDPTLLEARLAARISRAWATVMAAQAVATAADIADVDGVEFAARRVVDAGSLGSTHLQALLACDTIAEQEAAAAGIDARLHAARDAFAATMRFVREHPTLAARAAGQTLGMRAGTALLAFVATMTPVAAVVLLYRHGTPVHPFWAASGIPFAIASMVVLRARSTAAALVWSVAVYHAVADGFCPAAFAGSDLEAVAARNRAAPDAATSRDVLTAMRRDDLRRSTTHLLEELARYTTPQEVELVRERLASGRFRADHLDDLVHHRRAAWLARGRSAA